MALGAGPRLGMVAAMALPPKSGLQVKTDDLITMLAARAGAVVPDTGRRRFTTALGWGAFGATLLMALLLGVRPDMAEAARLPMFWIKLLFPALLAVVALLLAMALAHPGRRLRLLPYALAAPLVFMWALGAFQWLTAAPGQREHLLLGVSWNVCPLNIAVLSIPLFVAVFWAMKGLAPTRPALAGAAAGLVAGAGGALVYALHCIEMAAPFLGIWYVIGMLIPMAAGALIGRFALRW